VIHISNFITQEGEGQLLLRDPITNAVTATACEIIFPGAGGAAWWDHEQLMKQVRPFFFSLAQSFNADDSETSRS
jgi:hypothetical protein